MFLNLPFGKWFVCFFKSLSAHYFIFYFQKDEEIENDKMYFHMLGGCTALVALFILGKMYVANAGDSR